MNTDPSPVIEYLEKQKEVYSELLELSYEKRQVILKSDTERLSEIVQKEQRCLSKINSLEKKRAALIAPYAQRSPEGDVTLSVIIAGCENRKDAERLTVLGKELKALLASQADLNSKNKELLDAQMEYNETLMNIFVGSEDPLNNFYKGDGSSEDEGRRSPGMYDWQV